MKKTLIALMLVLVMVMTAMPFATAEDTAKEPITITMAGVLPMEWNDYPDNAQAKFIKENFGITIEIIDISERKEAMMASGDLPDVFIIESNELPPLIESGFILPLDDLFEEYGKDIVPEVDGMMDYLRGAMGDGEHIYAITGFGLPAGELDLSGSLWTQNWGLNVDWERYKELGCPEVGAGVDAIYDILVQLVNVKTTTDEGLPVYAIAYPTIEMRGRSLYACGPLGLYSANNFIGINCWDGSLSLLYTDPESCMWQFEHMYWKLNQDGLLDPDSFMMDFDSDSLKAVNGQYVSTLYHDITGNATKLKASEGVAGGFQYIPTEDSCIWAGGDGLYGGRNCRCIATSCKYPERVVELFNWAYNPENGRIRHSGFEGQTWNYVDGVPTLTDEACEAYAQMNEDYYNLGLAFGWNGGRGEKCADGYAQDLFSEIDYLSRNMTALEKDVQAQYGMSMVERVAKMYEDGKVTSQALVNFRVINNLQTLPTDLQRILNEVDATLNEGMVQCVMAPDEDTFFATRDALIAQVTEMGMDQVNDWFVTNYNELMAQYK